MEATFQRCIPAVHLIFQKVNRTGSKLGFEDSVEMTRFLEQLSKSVYNSLTPFIQKHS